MGLENGSAGISSDKASSATGDYQRMYQTQKRQCFNRTPTYLVHQLLTIAAGYDSQISCTKNVSRCAMCLPGLRRVLTIL
jgi:hypothetical protein